MRRNSEEGFFLPGTVRRAKVALSTEEICYQKTKQKQGLGKQAFDSEYILNSEGNAL